MINSISDLVFCNFAAIFTYFSIFFLRYLNIFTRWYVSRSSALNCCLFFFLQICSRYYGLPRNCTKESYSGALTSPGLWYSVDPSSRNWLCCFLCQFYITGMDPVIYLAKSCQLSSVIQKYLCYILCRYNNNKLHESFSGYPYSFLKSITQLSLYNF